MKQFIVFICLITILFTISSCGKNTTGYVESPPPKEETHAYMLKKENDNLYMHFSEEFLKKTKNISGIPIEGSVQIAVRKPRFSSVAELKDTIATENFSEDMLKALVSEAKNGVLEIPYAGEICDMVLPNGLKTETVIWGGIWYELDLDWGDNNYDAGYICVDLNGSRYDNYFNNTIVNYTAGAKTVISDRIIDDRNAQEFIYSNNTGKYKKLLYQIKDNGRVLYVLEHYYLDYYNFEHFDGYLSETTPLFVQTFCQEDGVCWNTCFKGFEERPSVEWLTSFGIKEITE